MGTVPVAIGAERIMGKLYDKMFYKVAPAGKMLMQKDLVLRTFSPVSYTHLDVYKRQT